MSGHASASRDAVEFNSARMVSNHPDTLSSQGGVFKGCSLNTTFKYNLILNIPMVAVETKKIGGSLMVRIPKEIVDREHITAGEIIELHINKLRPDLFGAFPQLKSWNKEEDRAHSKYE
jgi:hypothetical protein